MRIHLQRIAILAACLSLAASFTLAAAKAPQHTPPVARPAKAKRHQATGEILSLSPTTLVLLHARGRGRQKMVFHLTPQTAKTVPLAKDSRVTVIYIEENGRLDALRIRPPKNGKR